MKYFVLASLAAVFAAMTAPMAAFAASPVASHATSWDVGHRSRARLVLGAMPDGASAKKIVAGLEIVLQPGWKTYWRNPGDAGGVPPYFDWSKSENLKDAKVLFPAPHRFTDATGDTIGYKERVVLPIIVTPVDPARPVGLALSAEFGVCKDICIPARARLALAFEPRKVASMPPDLAGALGEVPTTVQGSDTRLPHVSGVRIDTSGKSRIVFDVTYPGGAAGADLFVEAVGDFYLPLARRSGAPQGRTQQFAIDISDGIDLAALHGRELRLTMTAPGVSSETRVRLP